MQLASPALAHLWFVLAAIVGSAACGEVDGRPGADAAPRDGGVGADGPEVALRTIALTISGDGTGAVTSDPAGLQCPGACVLQVPDGTSIILTAAADAGTSPAWSGPCEGGGSICGWTVDADVEVGVRFSRGWTCAPAFYADGHCDCGCGLVDPACADATLASCEYCDSAGSCSTQPCEGNTSLDPKANDRCL